MSTNPTSEHREQAREILRDDEIPLRAAVGNRAFENLVERIAAGIARPNRSSLATKAIVERWQYLAPYPSLIQARADIHTLLTDLSSRDAEIREVLEGLGDDDCYDACFLRWMKRYEDSDGFEHSEACLAARALYAKLQPKEAGDGTE